ncbi:hypothetical protein [Cedecea davisae]|uniref:hypothetical protein n=1 Tax=Cedecea davisae TaxID=158484 RepID=UPI002430E130|nr:hypothetical protein [Cedecea davisae]
MSQIFEIVQAMSGQKNSITIPVPYLDFFADDQQAHALGAMLNQLVFWSGKSDLNNGWFYKEHAELASEIRGVSADQVQRMAKKICQRWLPGVVEMKQAQVNGTKKTHYRVNGEALITRLFPQAMDSAESQNGKREVAEPVPQNRKTETVESQNPGREVAEPILYTDLNTDTDKQIIKPIGQPPAADKHQADSLKIDYQAVLEAYHTILPEMPKVIDMSNDRRNKLRTIWKKFEFNQDRWQAYLRYIAKHCRWMLENRPDRSTGKTWRKKNFDYLITEKCYLAVKEERANDLPKVERADNVARDEAYTSLIQQRRKPKNRVEEIAKAAAGKAGIPGRMTEVVARASWNGVWAQAVAQASEEDLARIA